MSGYFQNIGIAIATLSDGLAVTWHHFWGKKRLNVTLQYPHEKWPIPERNIGFEETHYNVIRSRLHVVIEDCIGCMKCVRACPVDCIKIDTVKAPKDMDLGTTSHDTTKRLLVARFDIDMAECCYCNLCTYPCPEDCIFMVGGPNSDRHPIDYEFSTRDRNDLVYRFAEASAEQVAQVAEAVSVANPLTVRAEHRERNIQIAAGLLVEEETPELQEKRPDPKPKPAPATAAEPKLDLSVLSAIEDRVVRGIAKKAAMAAFRAGQTGAAAAEAVKTALEESGKFTPEIGEIVARLADVSPAAPSETASESSVPGEAAAPADAGTMDITVLNPISDRVARSKAKAIFTKVKRQGGNLAEAAAEIRSTLAGMGKLDAEVEQVLTGMES